MDLDSGTSSTVGARVQAIPGRPAQHGALYQFKQQNLPACKPVLTPATVIASFLLMGFIFIPLGLITLRASNSVVEIVDRYDIECIPEELRSNKLLYITDDSISKNCSRFLKFTGATEEGGGASLTRKREGKGRGSREAKICNRRKKRCGWVQQRCGEKGCIEDGKDRDAEAVTRTYTRLTIITRRKRWR